MDEHFQIKLAMANRQHEHFLKLLDLFETRQTWAFNFAILLYTAAFTIFGVLLDKMYKPEQGWSPEYHMVVAGVLVLSVALPVLMLPLCFLYSDVSVFCAALTEGNRGHFDSTFKKLSKDATPYCPPGVLAFRWLHSDGRDIDIEWVANWRVSLFYIAPCSGLIACLIGVVLALTGGQTFAQPLLIVISVVGFLVSLSALICTIKACNKTLAARSLAHRDERPSQ